MEINIAIASYGRLKDFIHTVRPNYPPNINFIEVPASVPEEIKEQVERLEREGFVDAFVGSGDAGDCFSKVVQRSPVVRVKVSGFDLLSAINRIQPANEKVAILMGKERIPQISVLENLLTKEVVDYVYKDPHELAQQMRKLYDEGFEHVIGSTLVIEQAELLGMTGHYIWSAKSLQEALDIAIQIAYNKKDVQIRAQKMDLVLRNIHEGVVVTNAQGLIDQYNDSAERILRTDLSGAVGSDVEGVLPKIMIGSLNTTGNADKIITANKTKILANISPIYSNEKQSGYVITFQNIREISSAGEKIRNMHASGFVAKTRFQDMVGQSQSFLKMVETSQKYAKKESTIMIYGETGTGKELIAQSIHNASGRKSAQFVAVNCAAMPSDLLESELFGYEEGAFTGARKGGKPGFFELADGGTIFLDEIGEISPNFQTRLLRVLEQREIMRLGSERIEHVNIRVIAATNANLQKMVREKTFREDLFYRLNVLEVKIPPLRARKSDIPLLILHMLRKNRFEFDEMRRREIAYHPLFREYDWPGNVRELSNVIERFCALYTGGCNLEELIGGCMYFHADAGQEDEDVQAIRDALEQCGGNREKAAQLLGISRTTLWRMIKKHNVSNV